MPYEPKRPRPNEASPCCAGSSVKASPTKSESSPEHEENRSGLHDHEQYIGCEQMVLEHESDQRHNGNSKCNS